MMHFDELEDRNSNLTIWFARGGLAGVAVALALFLLGLVPALDSAEWLTRAMETLWPASVILIADPHGLMAVLFLAVALGFNFVLYGVAALLLALGCRLAHTLAAFHHS